MKFINALVVKLVDTTDLKSVPFLECQFESGRGHHLMRDKVYLVSDRTNSSLKIKSIPIKKINITSLRKLI